MKQPDWQPEMLYVKDELVGGCDIITEMFQSGELESLLAEKGIEHKTEA